MLVDIAPAGWAILRFDLDATWLINEMKQETKNMEASPTKPLGRMHIRARGGVNQTNSKMIGLWSTPTKPGTTLDRLKKAYLTGIESVDAIEARARDHAASGRFTPDGVLQATRQDVLNGAVPALHRARRDIKLAKAERDALRSKITLPKADKGDLVSAMQRAEMREWFRSKPQAERDALTRNPDKLDPQLSQALIEMPIEMTGIAATHRDLLIERTLEAQHSETIAEIKELDRAIERAENAVEASRDEVRKEAGIDQKTFDELAAPIEAKEPVAWLRRRPGSDEVRVVDLDRGIERLPTPEELANGLEASSLDEFNARKAS
jgi:hypothetical protein